MSLELFVLFGLILSVTIASIGFHYENLKYNLKEDKDLSELACIIGCSLLVGPFLYTFILTQQNNFEKGCLNYIFSLFIISRYFIFSWFNSLLYFYFVVKVS